MEKKGRKEAEKAIKEFFSSMLNKTPAQIKKIRSLAMSFNIKLGEKRKLFCKKCLCPFIAKKIRIKNNIKILTCENCGSVSRWRIT